MFLDVKRLYSNCNKHDFIFLGNAPIGIKKKGKMPGDKKVLWTYQNNYVKLANMLGGYFFYQGY